jgi:hypothetical protein
VHSPTIAETRCYPLFALLTNPAGQLGIFFSILIFLIIILEINRKTFFLNLTLFNRVNPSGVTYEGVTSGAGTCPGRHAGRDHTTLYQLRQLYRHDWCLSRVSLFDATEFPKYLTPLFLFLPLHFLSFYVLSPPYGSSISDSYFSPQILPRGSII